MSGGDFTTFTKNVVNELNPATAYNNIKNIEKNKSKAISNIDNETKDYANLVNETYKNKKNRQNTYHDYTLHPNASGDHYSTYQKGDQKYVVFRGTKDKRDIPDDLKILTGTEDFSKDEKLFKKIQEQLGDTNNNNWTVIGHSLGGTKAMLIGQKNGLKTHAFNPGYSRLFDDKLALHRNDLNLHLVSGDPISNGLLAHRLNNATIYKPTSNNPLKNHSINYFT